MRALLCESFGPPETLQLREVPTPEPGEGELLIRAHYAGVNFPDSLIIDNKYQIKPPLPFSPGGELAGVVAAVGPGVTDFKVGDRVAALSTWRAFADYVVVQAHRVIHVPDTVPLDVAGAITMTYGTSHYALKVRGQLKAGETLLVLGAAGGVGLAAVELGKAMGAKVIAGASTPEKLQIAKDFGADELIDYSTQDLKATLKALTRGKGVDVIYDPVGDRLAEPAFRSVAWQGRYLVVGFAGGQIPAIPLNLPLVKGASIVGVFWGESTDRAPKEHAENMAELYGWLVQGKLKPLISKRFMLEDAGAAIRWVMDRKATGKVVVDMGAGG